MVTSVVPSVVSAVGGTSVTFVGTGMNSVRMYDGCVIGTDRVSVQVVNDSALVCDVPSSGVGNMNVGVVNVGGGRDGDGRIRVYHLLEN